jgi:hypothetical protein
MKTLQNLVLTGALLVGSIIGSTAPAQAGRYVERDDHDYNYNGRYCRQVEHRNWHGRVWYKEVCYEQPHHRRYWPVSNNNDWRYKIRSKNYDYWHDRHRNDDHRDRDSYDDHRDNHDRRDGIRIDENGIRIRF